jgi:(1->4)-alpha-D-glucan 1-alpha-D-glucosylmutase
MAPEPAVRATYRLQLRNGFDFAAAEAVLPYLEALGVSHLYLSPIWRAAPGSTHGYDVVDPNAIEPELGGEAGFRALAAAAKARGLGIILDHVPNHMGIGPGNGWWWDVLAKGRESRFKGHFDIDWQAAAGATPGRVLLPVLGRPYGEVLDAGELEVVATEDGFELRHHDQRFPLQLDTLPETTLDLHALLERQPYRLAWWRLGGEALNYRRFFDIDGLVGVRVEDEAVFADCHRSLLALVREGLVDGVRLDHIDGLADPTAYLLRLDAALREAAGDRPLPPVWVEKILEGEERLRPDWPVAGTTGYEAADRLNRLFVAPEGTATLDALWRAIVGHGSDYAGMLHRAKATILGATFPGERIRLVADALAIAAEDRRFRDLGRSSLGRAIDAVITAFPVYRTYLDANPPTPADEELIRDVLAAAKASAGLEDDLAFTFLAGLLARTASDPAALDWCTRLQQLTGPIMAKSKEDTLFYRHHRLVALNEVGGEPGHMGLDADAFHAFGEGLAERHPACLLASSTHDTKRGEDVRARLVVLAEMADDWAAAVGEWLQTKPEALRATDAYLLYQTIVGAWPGDLRPDDTAGCQAFAERLEAYLVKAAREAKERTTWTAPDQSFEAALGAYARACLAPATAPGFHAWHRRLLPAGIVYGLAQTAFRLAMPGIPDIYQGSEGWNLALVDPDNRRPVDFASLARELAAPPPDFAQDWQDGRVKQHLIRQLLADRAGRPGLYAEGDYLPLLAKGPLAGKVVAFARLRGTEALVVAVPRAIAGELTPDAAPMLGAAFAATVLDLPGRLRDRRWRSLLGGGEEAGGMALGEAFSVWPLAVYASG